MSAKLLDNVLQYMIFRQRTLDFESPEQKRRYHGAGSRVGQAKILPVIVTEMFGDDGEKLGWQAIQRASHDESVFGEMMLRFGLLMIIQKHARSVNGFIVNKSRAINGSKDRS